MKADIYKSLEIRDKAINACMEYSDNPKQLKKVITGLFERGLTFDIVGTCPSPWEDNDLKMLLVIVRIGKDHFNFYSSYRDACLMDSELFKSEIYKRNSCLQGFKSNMLNPYNSHKASKAQKEVVESILYSVLCDAQSTLCSPDSFNDFCDDFGYDEDSMKAFDTYKAVSKHKRLLQKYIRPEQVESLPA